MVVCYVGAAQETSYEFASAARRPVMAGGTGGESSTSVDSDKRWTIDSSEDSAINLPRRSRDRNARRKLARSRFSVRRPSYLPP